MQPLTEMEQYRRNSLVGIYQRFLKISSKSGLVKDQMKITVVGYLLRFINITKLGCVDLVIAENLSLKESYAFLSLKLLRMSPWMKSKTLSF